MHNPSSLATRLRILIDAANSQKEVARLAGVSDGTLINWLRGCGVRPSKLRQVARKIGVSLEWLRDGVGNEKAEIATFRLHLRCWVHVSRNKFYLARERQGWSLNELGRRVGCPPALLMQIEDGRVRASEDLIKALCEALPGLSKEDFMDLLLHPLVEPGEIGDGTYDSEPDVLLEDGTKGRYVPLLSCAQVVRWEACGTHALREHPAIFALAVEDHRAFAIKILGVSMEPVFHDGDIVVCAPSGPIRNGDAAVVRTRRAQVFINFVHWRGERVLLKSAHSDYKPIDFPLAEIVGAWPIVQTITAGNVRRVNCVVLDAEPALGAARRANPPPTASAGGALI
jgi:transcriptional regulator with XRE-family HTH domain